MKKTLKENHANIQEKRLAIEEIGTHYFKSQWKDLLSIAYK